ncbi:MAG: hypothetical protein JJE44_13550 [Flavobacteriaceae bacterium]|nr:hypothetical protein [Flavobacteriaceae bacterium]
MKNEQKLLSEISKLTKKIETDYPEIYQFLDEIPVTIPSEKDPDINNKVLRDYLESLKQLIKNYVETRNIIKK